MDYLILDVPYLCYRALYSTGGLAHAGAATGVLFGVMRFVRDMENRWPLVNLCFCFDHGKNVREEIYPDYKITRRRKREEEMRDPAKKKIMLGFKDQVRRLKEELLADAGYRNVFYQDGYEADDVMAQVVNQMKAANQKENAARVPMPEVMLATGDHDLYQKVSSKVAVWHPKENKVVRQADLLEQYGVAAAEWVKVKATAGCTSDDIPGVPGIGDKKAAAFYKWAREGGTGPCPGVGPDKVNEICEFICSPEYVRNKFLVSLPLKGTEPVKVRRQTPNPDAWNRVVYAAGMKSLKKSEAGRSPVQVEF